MDPLFELAGLVLAHFDEEWIRHERPAPRIEPHAAGPAWAPAERRQAIETCRALIDEVKGVEQVQMAPPARERAARSAQPAASEELRSGEGPRPSVPFNSLRARRELLTERLYENADHARAAVRAVGRFPLYIEEVAPEVAAAVRAPDSPLRPAFPRRDDRPEGPSAADVADRLLTDRAFAISAATVLELPQPFAFILQQELEEIAASRRERGGAAGQVALDPAIPDPTADPGALADTQHPVRTAFEMGLFGLALSGGGIRSATFSLGVLQALSELRVLRHVDYLSTVSGGGYIGSWLVGWISRLSGGVDEVQQRLCPTRGAHPTSVEARALRMLREYSNYLTPRAGFLSADTWTMIVIWLRNTFLNLLVILLLLVALLVSPRWLVPAAYALSPMALAVLAAAAGLVAAGFAAWNLRTVDEPVERAHQVRLQPDPRGNSATGVTWLIVLPMMAGTVAATVLLWKLGQEDWYEDPGRRVFLAACAALFTGLVIVQFGGKYARCMLRVRGQAGSFWGTARAHAGCLAAGLLVAPVGGLLVMAVLHLITRGFPVPPGGVGSASDVSFWLSIAFVPPLLAEILAVTVALHIGLLGIDFPDERREWWSRLGAHQLLVAAVWIAGFACVMFAAPLLHHLHTVLPAALVWVATTWGGVLAGRASDGGGESKKGPVWRVYLAGVAPYVFIIGLLLAVGGLIHAMVVAHDAVEGARVAGWVDATLSTDGWEAPALIFGSAALLCLVLSWRFDVNEFSMHHFYKNRLVRCYLGASHDQESRRPNRFTGFDPRDDIKLAALRVRPPSTRAAAGHGDASTAPFTGPYPIINAALNLTKGRELAWQERKAESFVFTPQFTGYEITEDRAVGGPNLVRAGYRPTSKFAYPGGPGIGTAAAISGAAANPNMGYHSSPATAFLLTVFNARLGWWLGNPRYTGRAKTLEPWRTSSPRLGLVYLLRELTGGADNRTRYVNVSDGGHFENLGLYELVRRRCRFILAVDSEQDAAMSFGGLSNAIRKCRTDFGVSIELDVRDLRPVDGHSTVHCTAGPIYYPEPGAAPGHILYIKSSLTGDESPDVLSYAAREPAFPHQSTGDQWFNESQFESYRMLGYHAARHVLSLAARSARAKAAHASPAGTPMSMNDLFQELRDFWTPNAVVSPDDAKEHASLYSALYASAFANPSTLDTTLFPAPPTPLPHQPPTRDALFVAHSMIELMHRVFLDRELDRFANRPNNAGWMRIFKAWAADADVNSAWRSVRSQYSGRFQLFVDRLSTWQPGGFN